MKKLSWLFLAGLMAVFTACSNADDDDPIDNGGGVVPPVGASGSGTEADPYNVTAAIAQNNSGVVAWVKGYIVGQISGKSVNDAQFAPPFTGALSDDGVAATAGTNLLIAASPDETNVNKCLAVQLPFGDIRTALELVGHPDNDSKEVVLQGGLIKYFGTFGLKEVTTAKFDGKTIGGSVTPPAGTPSGNGSEADPYNVAGVIAQNNSGVNAWTKGYIVGQIAGKSVADAQFAAPFTGALGDDGVPAVAGTNLILADSPTETNIKNCVIVQLPAGDIRTALELVGKPENDGKMLMIYGQMTAYFGASGLKTPTAAIFDGQTIGTKPSDPTDAIFSESFASGFGQFSTMNVAGDQIWKADTQYKYVSMSAYNNSDKQTYTNEDWLISPAIDLTGVSDAVLTFGQAFGPKTSGIDKSLYTVLVSTQYNGSDLNVEWYPVTITFPAASDWSFITSTSVLPAEVQGKANVRIAFKYKNLATDKTATWELKELKVAKGQ